jgi:hypothetical protein
VPRSHITIAGFVRVGDRLGLALNVVDRPLRRLAQRRRCAPRKAAAEDDAGGFRERLDVLAEEEANELEDGGLARSGTAREDDAAGHVALTAVAGFHGVRR